jgi:hypothetical protein
VPLWFNNNRLCVIFVIFVPLWFKILPTTDYPYAVSSPPHYTQQTMQNALDCPDEPVQAQVERSNMDRSFFSTVVQVTLSTRVPVPEQAKQHLVRRTRIFGVRLEAGALEVLDGVSLAVGRAYLLELF